MNIKFYDGELTTPKVSGNYLVMLANGHMWDCAWSVKHHAWNAYDENATNENPWTDVKAWAVKPSVEEMDEEVW